MKGQRQQEARAYGRILRDQLMVRYREEYGIDVAPPPALIVDELLTDFMVVVLKV